MRLRPYHYLGILPVSISCFASYLSISSNTKTIINLIAALLVITSIPLSYRDYKKSKRESRL
ncbi:hypothetical protein FC756_08225 [Lysinibacillus mangiferihumi]|uniref:Lipoprotein n=1 Tax=Lysinibacillus mangiferihumi TaxID=1130819 RepID=A0A4U2Z6U6_9BACI|nr:hypothetical protein [Lysinibacillus mangiferihumi]TKI70086.1 hypothetical protein FC756_08225 [Lysinibacillus mangiferihumi]